MNGVTTVGQTQQLSRRGAYWVPLETNGNLAGISEAAGLTTMAYDKENRLVSHITHDTATPTTYTYDGTGLKRAEITNSSRTTLVWDGSDYLQGRD